MPGGGRRLPGGRRRGCTGAIGARPYDPGGRGSLRTRLRIAAPGARARGCGRSPSSSSTRRNSAGPPSSTWRRSRSARSLAAAQASVGVPVPASSASRSPGTNSGPHSSTWARSEAVADVEVNVGQLGAVALQLAERRNDAGNEQLEDERGAVAHLAEYRRGVGDEPRGRELGAAPLRRCGRRGRSACREARCGRHGQAESSRRREFSGEGHSPTIWLTNSSWHGTDRCGVCLPSGQVVDEHSPSLSARVQGYEFATWRPERSTLPSGDAGVALGTPVRAVHVGRGCADGYWLPES